MMKKIYLQPSTKEMPMETICNLLLIVSDETQVTDVSGALGRDFGFGEEEKEEEY